MIYAVGKWMDNLQKKIPAPFKGQGFEFKRSLLIRNHSRWCSFYSLHWRANYFQWLIQNGIWLLLSK